MVNYITSTYYCLSRESIPIKRNIEHILLSDQTGFIKGALKGHIHISLYESNTLQEQDAALLFSLSDPMREDFCILPSSCSDPGSGHVFQLGGNLPLALCFLPLALCL